MEALRNLQKEIGFTNKEMAQELGVSLVLYEQVITGHRNPSNNFTNKVKKRFPFVDVNNFFCK